LIFEPEKYARHQATSAFDVDLEGRPLQKAAAGVEKIGDGFSLWA
jgi:hypothetical protein